MSGVDAMSSEQGGGADVAHGVTPVFFLAGGTGISAETLGNLMLAQFPSLRFRRRKIPFITTLEQARDVVTQRISRPVTRAALVSAASTTIAVPCWSSCITGQSRASMSRCSSSKQRGAGDVLKVHGTEAGPQADEGLDDFIHVRGVQDQRN